MFKNKVIIITLGIIVCFLLPMSYAQASLNLQNAFQKSYDAPLGTVAGLAKYNTDSSPASVIGLVINIVLSILGILFIFLMVYGGYLWMTAMGNETQSTKAKDLIQAAVIGLIIMLAAYAISYFVTNALVSPFMKTQPTGTMEIQQVNVPTPEASPNDQSTTMTITCDSGLVIPMNDSNGCPDYNN
jgi:hypothetical protein